MDSAGFSASSAFLYLFFLKEKKLFRRACLFPLEEKSGHSNPRPRAFLNRKFFSGEALFFPRKEVLQSTRAATAPRALFTAWGVLRTRVFPAFFSRNEFAKVGNFFLGKFPPPFRWFFQPIGGDLTAGSPTVTLLRLNPPHEALVRIPLLRREPH